MTISFKQSSINELFVCEKLSKKRKKSKQMAHKTRRNIYTYIHIDRRIKQIKWQTQLTQQLNNGSFRSMGSISHDDVHNKKQTIFETTRTTQILEDFIDNSFL